VLHAAARLFFIKPEDLVTGQDAGITHREKVSALPYVCMSKRTDCSMPFGCKAESLTLKS
jgi:hypothetical protein